MNPQSRRHQDLMPSQPMGDSAEDERIERKRRQRVVELAEKLYVEHESWSAAEAVSNAEAFVKRADAYLKTGK